MRASQSRGLSVCVRDRLPGGTGGGTRRFTFVTAVGHRPFAGREPRKCAAHAAIRQAGDQGLLPCPASEFEGSCLDLDGELPGGTWGTASAQPTLVMPGSGRAAPPAPASASRELSGSAVASAMAAVSAPSGSVLRLSWMASVSCTKLMRSPTAVGGASGAGLPCVHVMVRAGRLLRDGVVLVRIPAPAVAGVPGCVVGAGAAGLPRGR